MKRIPILGCVVTFLLLTCPSWPVIDSCCADTLGSSFISSTTRGDDPGLSDPSSAEGRRFLLSSRSMGILLGIGGAALISKSFDDQERLAAGLDGSPLDGMLDAGGVYGDGHCDGAIGGE